MPGARAPGLLSRMAPLVGRDSAAKDGASPGAHLLELGRNVPQMAR